MALRQEPTALGKRIAEVLDRPAGQDKGKEAANDRFSDGPTKRCLL